MATSPKSQPNKFVVDLGGIALTENDRNSIAAAIQGAVLSYLAAHHQIPTGQVKLRDDLGINGMFISPDDKSGKGR